MKTSIFDFFKISTKAKITEGLRLSVWLEGSDYAMPSEFQKVVYKEEIYVIKIISIDPKDFLSERDLGKKFFFGNPGTIIGYGILKEVL